MNPRQARLSLVMGVVAALGTAAILWVWWDSTGNLMFWVNSEWVISSDASKVVIRLGHSPEFFYFGSGFQREIWNKYGPEGTDLFPDITMSPGNLVLPMWFILGVFLSVLLLLWLFLMKRLARPRITEG